MEPAPGPGEWPFAVGEMLGTGGLICQMKRYAISLRARPFSLAKGPARSDALITGAGKTAFAQIGIHAALTAFEPLLFFLNDRTRR